MSATGYIQVHAFASRAQLPLRDVAIVITDEDGTGLAMRLTDQNGTIRAVQVNVPEKSESQTPHPGEHPYTLVNLFAYKEGYERIEAEGLQVFADTTTYQDLEMIPLAEFPENMYDTIHLETPPQNL